MDKRPESLEPQAQPASPASTAADAPTNASRRRLLLGLGVGGGAAALGALVATTVGANVQPKWPDTTSERQPFFGNHQAGIVTPQPAAALVVAFDVLAKDKAALERLFRLLTARADFLTKGGRAPEDDPRMPPMDSGVLGPNIYPDNLTMTVSVGASIFDQRFGLAEHKPKHLGEMPQFPNDQLDADLCHGDLLLQICSNTAETNIHALRDIVKHTPDLLSVRWKMDGFLPPHTLRKMGTETVRNLLGFKDGSANIDAQNDQLMNQLVWVSDQSAEPSWTVGGSYQVVRVVRNLVEQWDRTPLREQENIIGRDKANGAPLGHKNEHDVPDFADDPHGKKIPMDAHIRLANPRTEATKENLILRRGYNYSRGITKSGQFDMGLLFVAYQADLMKGFVTVQTRLNGEPLEEYIKPIGGGYFFALPGVSKDGDFLGQGLLTA
ncbi:iron uptake transporter deferrochelatase/peroxidase subunit [Amantichitinum ursilacus]|uniref:Deferrochelatase n=1 Tax=Amantichitinum ursilacus TaxID=857265 RepID=A0A0N1JS59_9NEIS|nr:iron uptake transporter deferrochelatase/peroxidase subunit [Amantichitinum ursilacus]KPC51897.1 Deferrochelatase/peroxidase EfeB precursor [Amantichitinum ursilacus]